MNGNHQNGYFGETCRYLAGNVKPIQIRHLEIEQNNVGAVLLHAVKGFASGSRLIRNLPIRLLLQEPSQIVPYYWIIVCDQNANQEVPSYP